MNVCMYAHLKFYECARVVKNEYVTYVLFTLFTSFCEEFFSAVSSPKSVCTEAYSTDCGAEIRLYSLAH